MGEEDLVTKDGEMIKVLAAFIMVFTGKTCFQQSQAPKISGKSLEQGRLTVGGGGSRL